MFEDLQTPEDIEAFLAERRRVLSDSDWRILVHQLADEMAKRADTPLSEIMQRIRVYKRATDQLELPEELEPPAPTKAETRGWTVLDGGRPS